MKVFLDTNIIFSAILFPNSIPDKAFQKALSSPYEAYTSNYVIDELKRNFINKFPSKIVVLENFLYYFTKTVKIVTKTYDINDESIKLRDKYDKPVLRAALEAKCDLLITGDKDFLESNIKVPKIVKAREFYFDM